MLSYCNYINLSQQTLVTNLQDILLGVFCANVTFIATESPTYIYYLVHLKVEHCQTYVQVHVIVQCTSQNELTVFDR